MSNARYYARRAAGLCGECGQPTSGAYCAVHREERRQHLAAERAADRDGYNLYMRVYKQQRRTRAAERRV
jgi:hypothetical protein